MDSNVIPLTDTIRERRLLAAADVPTLRALTRETGDTGTMAAAELFLRGERHTDSPGIMKLAGNILTNAETIDIAVAGGQAAADATFDYAEGQGRR